MVRINKEFAVQSNVGCAERIFAEHGDFIRGVIRSKVGNSGQAEDLFQDIFLTLVSKPPPAGVKNIKTYLYAVVTNDIVDATRRIENYKARIGKYAEHFNYSVDTDTPENILIDIEKTLKMFGLIEKQLPHSEAEAVTLRHKDNYKVKEIAERMDVNIKTVNRYLSGGLSRIRRFLTPNQGNIDGRNEH